RLRRRGQGGLPGLARSADDRALGRSGSGRGDGQRGGDPFRLRRRAADAHQPHQHFCQSADSIARPTRSASPPPGHRRDERRSGPSQWLAEAVATFTLILAILGGIRFAPDAVPWLVGLTITAAYWFTSSTSFANPAVTLARGFTTSFAGIAINHVPGFVAAQLAGAVIGSTVSAILFRTKGSDR